MNYKFIRINLDKNIDVFVLISKLQNHIIESTKESTKNTVINDVLNELLKKNY